MIPCPECDNLCGIEDTMLLGELLWYRCPRCRSCFELGDAPQNAAKADVFRMPLPLVKIPMVKPPPTNPIADVKIANLKEPFGLAPSAAMVRAAAPSTTVAFPWDEVTPVLPPPKALVDQSNETVRAQIERAIRSELEVLYEEDVDVSLEADDVEVVEEPPPPKRPTPMTFAVVDDDDPRRTMHSSLPPPNADKTSPSLRRRARSARAVQGVALFAAMMGLVALVSSTQLLSSEKVGASAAGNAIEFDTFEPSREPARPNAPAAAVAPFAIPAAEPAVGSHTPPEETAAKVATNSKPVQPKAPAPEAASRVRPTDVVARIGLTNAERLTHDADQAYRSGDVTTADTLYRRALSHNSSYLPARLGAAAVSWDRGAKSSARSQYQAIVAEVPPNLVPDVARQRAK